MTVEFDDALPAHLTPHSYLALLVSTGAADADLDAIVAHLAKTHGVEHAT